jgi:hypothetical protein
MTTKSMRVIGSVKNNQDNNNLSDNNEADDKKDNDQDNYTKPIFGLRNDTETNSDHSYDRPSTPESGNDVFNPFKSPVVPEAIGSPEKNESKQNKSIASDENRSESGEIKFVSDQYSEWNKRITKALNNENYYNDEATKLSKRIPSNPLDKLTIESMKDENRSPSSKGKKYLRPSTSRKSIQQNYLQVAGSENKRVELKQAKTLFVSFNPDDEVKSPKKDENDKLINDVLKLEIILVIINTEIVSDFEINRSKKYLKDFLNANPECVEGHYGLSQVYFSLGQYNKALEEINISLMKNNSDSQFLTWKAIYLYYLFKNLSDKGKKIDALRKCEETCKKILVKERRNLFPLYLLFTLMIEVQKLRAQGTKISSNSTKKPEDYAKRIKELNAYLGEIAYAEIQLADPEQVIQGRDKLIKVVEKYPKYPHGFVRL